MKTDLHWLRIQGITRIEVLVIVVVVVMVVLVLTGLFLPAFAGNRASPERMHCLVNLKDIGLAFRMWAADNDNQFPQTVRAAVDEALESNERARVFRVFPPMSEALTDAMAPDSHGNNPTTRLLCPADRRKAAPSLEAMRDENISYFLGVDARPERFSMMFMGDRNLAHWVDTKGFTETARLQGLVSLRTNPLIGWDRGLHKTGGNVLLTDGSVQQFINSLLRQHLPNTGDTTNRVLFPQ